MPQKRFTVFELRRISAVMNFPKVLLSNEAQIIVLTSVKTWGLFHEGVSFRNTSFWKYLVMFIQIIIFT